MHIRSLIHTTKFGDYRFLMLDYSIHYRKWHDGSKTHFDATAGFYHRLLAPSLESVPPESRILDIGCGQGLLVYALNSFGFKNVQGIDLSEQQVAVGQKFGLPCHAVDKQYIFGLARTHPATFDLIFLMDVLEHLDKAEQLRVLTAISDLLVPGGRLILSVPNANASFGLRWRYIDWTHETAFTEHSLEFILLNSNFTDLKFLPYEFITRPRLFLVPRPSTVPWILQNFFRFFRRLEAVGEMGVEQGRNVPLSLNLLVQCVKLDEKF
jgi:2-polyprenyl-3-methyl-5-hydroxy-6-metoxy-1,4-benzoquinol methylase